MNDSNETLVKGSKANAWALRLVIAGLLLCIAGPLGARAGLSPMIAMLLISLGSLSFIVGGIIAAVGLARGGSKAPGAPAAWAALALGVATIINAGNMMGGGGAPIHDISTDTNDPPLFVVVAELRGPDDNPAEYAGSESAAMQAEAYPDIETIVLLDPRTFVFEKALEVAEGMGWEIVASDATAGTIEATATTPFVGFKDDVVIRVRADGAETLVDVRSKSRIGRGDMGVNAQRIRDFRESLIAAANP